jgi:transposase InsO family protein
MDFVNGLPGSHSNMFSLIDYSMSWVESWPCRKTDANMVMKFLKEWAHRYGWPEQIITDNATQFQTIAPLCMRYGIEITYVSVSYAQTNGKIKRYQGVVGKLIAKAIADHEDVVTNWRKYVSKAIWSWRIQIKDDMGVSPYVALYGQDP